MARGASRRLLVFNCHESWIAQLDGLPFALDILIGLPGRFATGWDAQARPVPAGARLVTLTEARAGPPYDCLVLHSASDVLAAKGLGGARLLVVHNTLEGRLAEEPSGIDLATLREAILQLLHQTNTHAIAVSPLKARSWGLDPANVLPHGLDVEAFGPYLGSLAAGIRVANHVHQRQRILRWGLHAAAFDSLPVTLVGHNPGVIGSVPARSFAHLKDLLRVHRFYVHTSDPELEDGYNLAMLEAMASGLPIVGTPHPSSPVRHGVEGFLAEDAGELPASPPSAGRCRAGGGDGRAGRARVAELFSPTPLLRIRTSDRAARPHGRRRERARRAAARVAAFLLERVRRN